MKVNRSLKNRKILFKGTTEKIISQEEELLGTYYMPLMKVGLSLMENIFWSWAKNFSIPLGLTAEASSTNSVTPKKI